MTVRSTHIVPSVKTTHTVLDNVTALEHAEGTRITQTIIRTRVRIVEPTLDTSGSSGGGASGRKLIVLTEDTLLKASQDGDAWTNRGADIDITATLPSGSDLKGGERFAFRSAVDGRFLRVSTSGSDTLWLDNRSLFYVRCNEYGGCIEFEYQGAGVFFAIAPEIGLWLLDE